MRLVVGDGLGDLLQRVEAIRLLAHELADLFGSGRADPGGDVDQDKRFALQSILAEGGQAGVAAHRRADQDRRAGIELLDHPNQILDHDVTVVIAVGGPLRIAMASGIEGNRVVAGSAEGFADSPPGVPCLPTAVLQDDQRAVWVAPTVAGDADPGPVPIFHGHRGAR